MLDNILNSVRRSAEKVQRRGEEVAQIARLRVEVYQLSRELDTLYARLGRAYHAGSDAEVLEELSQDVRRLNEEIASREQLIAELNAVPEEELRGAEAVHAAAARTRAPQEAQEAVAAPLSEAALGGASEPNLGDLPDAGRDAAHPVPPSDAPAPAPTSNAPAFVEHPPTAAASAAPAAAAPTAASRIWRAKEEERMTDNEKVDPTGPDGEKVMGDLGKELPPRKRDYSGVGDEDERERMRRHPITLAEGEESSAMPDPLDK
ncbi:hypothetical protein [Deinococcus irradiatisoli]|uniref:hypothetical protein n=1 Tax=Deinococcus irradiatisoli TaxID=2202254 RepID=UPI0015E84406|nr:hypothetical protein [Deinococcus irradiatisoli]